MRSSDHPAPSKQSGILLSPISCKAASLLDSPSFREGLRNLRHDSLVTKHLNSPLRVVSVSSYPKKDLGQSMLLPAYPLCAFSPLLSPFVLLKALKLPGKETISQSLGALEVGLLGSLVYALPPPSSMGCREFAPGLRWGQELPPWLCGSFKVVQE